jgi:hypothetical protein
MVRCGFGSLRTATDPPHFHLTRESSKSKSIRVHSRPWRLGPSTWGKRRSVAPS